MADFSIQDAALAGFGVVRAHRGFLVVWAGLALVVSVALTAVTIAIGGPSIANLQTLAISGSHDPSVVFPIFNRLAPLYLVLGLASVVFYGVLCAAMNRAVLRPQDRGLAYLGLGSDECRQMAILLIGTLFFSLAYIALVFGLLLITVIVNSVAHLTPSAAAFISVALATTVMMWLAVRFSLASALTFQRRRVTFWGSWNVTKGRSWTIFGTYILVFALVVVIFLLTYLVILAVVAVATGGNLSVAFATSDMRTFGAYFSLAHSLQLVLGAGVSALMWPVLLTPPAAILKQLSANPKNGLAERGSS